MTRLRTLVEASGPSDQPLMDSQATMSRYEFVALVDALRERLEGSEFAGRRICLPLDSTLGSLATLVAVLETDASAALIPRPAEGAAPDWPGFCDAVFVPPGVGQGAEAAELRPLPRNGTERGEDLTYLRTSGTTGTPKWAIHATARFLGNAPGVVERFGLTQQDRVMIPVPIHHMYGLGAAVGPALLAGAAIMLVPRGNPLEVFRAQRSFEPTVMYLVPSQCRSIMALNRKAGRSRIVVVAGDRLAAYEAASFEEDHGTVVAHYGTTELGFVTASRPDDPADLRFVTAGTPLDDVSLDLGAEPPDDAAEGARPLRVRHPRAFLGYADADGRLAAPAPEVWPTGDLVRLHAGDHVEVLGRADHAVKRDGLFVHMGEVEACLTRAAGVAQAAVVTAGHTRRGAGLTAFCALQSAGSTSEEAVLQHCRGSLPARAVPDRLVLLDALPMLPSGKVDRRRLAAEAEALLEG